MNRSAPLDVFAYAALIAELARGPERRAKILAERGLTEAALTEVERWYSARFEASPEERKELERLVAVHQSRSEQAPDLDRTAEITGEVLAVSLPFRTATPADSERIAQRSPESVLPADSAQLDGTLEAPNQVIAAAPLPFAATPEHGPTAILTAFPWRAGDGRLRTTVVGKLSVHLQAGAPPILVPSDPLVAFDRVAADPRFVEAASETAPWAVSASIITYGGPLRFTFHPASGEPLQRTAAAGDPVGWSMSNPQRARYAPKPPTRGPDHVLMIPEGIDGRYFIATPEAQPPKAIVGNERVVLEVGSARYDAMLPAKVIVAAIEIGGQRREITLTFDTLAVHGGRRLIALIGRVTLPGEATLVGHRLASLSGEAVTPFQSGRSPSEPKHVSPALPDEAYQPARALIDAGVAAEPEPPKPRKPTIARPKPGAMAKPRFKKR